MVTPRETLHARHSAETSDDNAGDIAAMTTIGIIIRLMFSLTPGSAVRGVARRAGRPKT
jgi:hypothetical protein